MRASTVTFLLTGTLIFVLSGVIAHAQTVDLTDNYNLSYRSLEKREPLKLGSFKAGGDAGVAGGYSDNVNNSAFNREEGGFISSLASLWLSSDWDDHALSFSGFVKSDNFPTNSEADEIFARVFAYGRLDLPENFQFELVGSYVLDEQARGDINEPFNPNRSSSDQEFDARAFLTKSFGDLAVTLRSGVRRNLNENVFANAGFSLNRDDENSFLYDFRLRGSLNLGNKYNAFVEAGYNRWDFDDRFDRNGFERGSNGVHAAAGILFYPLKRLRGEIAAGYRGQFFPDAAFDTLVEPTLDAWVTFAATEKVNLSFIANTFFQEETNFGGAGTLGRSFFLQVDYRARDRLRLFGKLAFLNEDEFRPDSNPNWTQRTTAGLDFELAPHLFMTAQYEREDFLAGFQNGDYSENRFLLGLTVSR
ncbi:MAG: outer membrane beta-barrel protein [Pseudomonadota bacterium]